jgi:membrane fusion protein, multidrug efflux system
VGDGWVINSGLKPGDRIIVDGVMKIGPGAPVKISDGAAPAKSKDKGAGNGNRAAGKTADKATPTGKQ